MCVDILGSRSFSNVLGAGHSRLIARQFLPMLSSLPSFLDQDDYCFVPYFRYLSS